MQERVSPPVVPGGESVYPAGDAPELIGETIWRIPLPLPFALRSVNIYLLDDGPGARVLIDAGLGLVPDIAAIRAGIAQAGLALEDISTIVLTHAHPDHVGYSGPIQAACGAPVYMLGDEARRMQQIWGAENTWSLDATEDFYVRNGFPLAMSLESRARSQRLRSGLRVPSPEVVRSVEPETTIQLGAHSYQTFWTPGHSDYHLCLLRDDGYFFAGDHVLPGITPNIGFYPNARPDPLDDYLNALDLVRDLSVRLVLPGHRQPFTDLAGRVGELRAHHEERSAQVLALLAAQPDGQDAAQVAGALFGARLRIADDWRFAIAETLAHLEYLRRRDAVASEEREERVIYRVANGSANSLP